MTNSTSAHRFLRKSLKWLVSSLVLFTLTLSAVPGFGSSEFQQNTKVELAEGSSKVRQKPSSSIFFKSKAKPNNYLQNHFEFNEILEFKNSISLINIRTRYLSSLEYKAALAYLSTNFSNNSKEVAHSVI